MPDEEVVVTADQTDPPYVDDGPPVAPDEVPEPVEDPETEAPSGVEP